MKKVLLLAISSLLLVACQQNVVFTEYESLPADGWNMDSVVVFHPTIEDSIGNYQMLISIRHTDRYPYQNMWMFVDVKQDSVLLRRDTIEAQMANARGEWYGKGLSEHTLPIIYLENITLPKGEYTPIILVLSKNPVPDIPVQKRQIFRNSFIIRSAG